MMGCISSKFELPNSDCMCVYDSSVDANDVTHRINDDEGPEYLKILDGSEFLLNKNTDGITKSTNACNPHEIDRSHFSNSIQLLGIGRGKLLILYINFPYAHKFTHLLYQVVLVLFDCVKRLVATIKELVML